MLKIETEFDELDRQVLAEDHYIQAFESFKKTIASPEYGFFELNIDEQEMELYQSLSKKHQSKTHFIHVGIGGSALGAEFLINSLATRSQKDKFVFLNNIDSDDVADKLERLDPRNCVCYIVTKSGGTAETMASFSILANWFNQAGVENQSFKDHFVFSTDPKQGDLLQLGQELEIPTLVIPSNIGGRFSVMTSVGMFPACFAGLDLSAFQKGLETARELILQDDLKKNHFFQLGAYIGHLKNEFNIAQTVIMPYSSKLKSFSDWFVQLWAESLGKKLNLNHELAETGLTPIAAYGATDQHSQMQLFMHGPRDKFLILLEVEKRSNDYSLGNSFTQGALSSLSRIGLNQLMKAEYEGTKKALKGENRKFSQLRLEKLDESHIAELILFSESLTVLVGDILGINPFDQPGVEAGKIFAKQWLAQ